MLTKITDDFVNSSKKNNIDYWPIHNCSMCGYQCGFLFGYGSYDVLYDSGCHCTKMYLFSKNSWQDVADQYNININNNDTIKKYNDYWHFKEKDLSNVNKNNI